VQSKAKKKGLYIEEDTTIQITNPVILSVSDISTVLTTDRLSQRLFLFMYNFLS